MVREETASRERWRWLCWAVEVCFVEEVAQREIPLPPSQTCRDARLASLDRRGCVVESCCSERKGERRELERYDVPSFSALALEPKLHACHVVVRSLNSDFTSLALPAITNFEAQ